MKKLDIAAAALVIVGALNWGLVAIADFDVDRLTRTSPGRPDTPQLDVNGGSK